MKEIMIGLIQKKRVVFYIKKTGKAIELKYSPDIKLIKLVEEVKNMLELSYRFVLIEEDSMK